MLAEESACQVVPDAQQEELVAGEVLVANVTEAVPDEQVVQAVLMADEDSTTVWESGGGTRLQTPLMLHDYEEDLLKKDVTPLSAEGLQEPWTKAPEAIPLELETPEAASFIPLDDLPLDQAELDSKINEFFDTAERNVSQAMKDAVPGISKFFKSKQARRVFGATIELVYKPDLPAEMRSRVRPITIGFSLWPRRSYSGSLPTSWRCQSPPTALQWYVSAFAGTIG